MKILILNGPNLNMLGKREVGFYGSETFDSIFDQLQSQFPDLQLTCYQSNHEGELIDKIHQYADFDGIVINGGAYSHYSYAIMDALALANIPKVEVHFSNIHSRESFRAVSVLSKVCDGVICGFGKESYRLALEWFRQKNAGIGLFRK